MSQLSCARNDCLRSSRFSGGQMDMPPHPPPPLPGVFSSLSRCDKRSTSSARNPFNFV